MSQNLCLVCCYSFQEKRTRFISDESREGFNKFCTDLGFSFRNKGKGRSCLELPFGDAITVCGDCLSLIVLYVQRRSIQLEQEEKLEELQRAVVKALKELSLVVKDVHTHVNELHDIIRTGDESSLEKFFSMDNTPRGCGDEAKTFRDSILSLDNGAWDPDKEAAHSTQEYKEIIVPVISVQPDLVKEEPMDYAEAYDEDSPYDDELEDPCHQNMANDLEDSRTSPVVTTTSGVERNVRKRITSHHHGAVIPEESSEPESDSDYDAASNFSEDCKTEKRSIRRITRKDSNTPKRGPGRPRKVKPETPLSDVAPEPSQSPEEWKNHMIGRILEQWGSNDAISQVNANKSYGFDNQGESISNQNEGNTEAQAGQMQIVDGGLQFRGIKIQILEQQKALVCMRCGKKFKEDKVKTAFDNPVETVMQNHIINKHPPPKKRRRVLMEVTPYTSTTRTKVTYKIACKNMYTYTRRCRNSDGRGYYRCDARKANCGATILFSNGEYIRMKNGWTDDGYHTMHPPDPAKTEEHLVLGKAKEYTLSNPTLTIHEIFNNIVNDSNGQLPIPAKRLKRILHVSRYGHQRLPEAEKRNRVYHCPNCTKSCRDARGLARHIKTQHKNPLKTEDVSGSAEVTSSDKITTKLKRSPKRIERQIKSDPLPPTNTSNTHIQSSVISEPPPVGNQAPCGMFADTAQAHNFVNKCITAIMQQVGIPVPTTTNPVIPIDRPTGPPSVCSNSSITPGSPVPDHHDGSNSGAAAQFPSTSPASSSQQQRLGPSSYGNQNPGQWNQFSIPSHGQHPQGQFNLTPNNSHFNPPNQLQSWPWRAGPH